MHSCNLKKKNPWGNILWFLGFWFRISKGGSYVMGLWLHQNGKGFPVRSLLIFMPEITRTRRNQQS